MKLKAKTVFVVYVILIFVYAYIYYLNSDMVNAQSMSYVQSVYFSVVTITTLGYGDIVPINDLGRGIVASEAILGLVIIGLFLNSLWQYFASTIEQQQKELLASNLKLKNRRELLLFYEYLETEIIEFQRAICELTIPNYSNKDVLLPHLTFQFSDLKNLYKSSLNTTSGINKPIIHLYYERLDMLLIDLKLLMVNYDLSDYAIFHQRIVKFLKMSYSHDVREAFYSYETTEQDNRLLKDTLTDIISSSEHCPDLTQHSAHIVTPAIILYQTVSFQVMEIAMIIKEFEQLKGLKNQE